MQALPADRGTKRKAHSIADGIPEGVTEVRHGDGCGGRMWGGGAGADEREETEAGRARGGEEEEEE